MRRVPGPGTRTTTVRFALLLLLGVACSAAFQMYGSGRDEAAFRTYVQTHMGRFEDSRDPGLDERDRAWAQQHPDLALAEAHRSCAWLSTQPTAPDPAPDEFWTSGAAQARYTQDAAPLDGLSEWGRSTLVAGAWEYLCGDEHRKRTSPTLAQLHD